VSKRLSIALVASEATPFSKTGGLADVAGALPTALAALGHSVSLFVPLYMEVDRDKYKIPKRGGKLQVPVSARIVDGKYRKITWRGVEVYFIENDGYYHRQGLYTSAGGDHPDNAERFSFFCRAALLAMKKAKVRPDVIHVNDWQSALTPVYLQELYQNDKALGSAATVITIHNMGYQGHFSPIEWHLLGLDYSLYNMNGLEFYGKINFLKGGILYSDIITTVSGTYSKEIQTPDGGWGLDPILRDRSKDVFGVVNGIDTDEWNPDTDKYIAANFKKGKMDGKARCKEALLNELGLPVDEDPLIVMITRLAEQKGVDIGFKAVERAIGLGIKFALLGSGSKQYEDWAMRLQAKYPANVSIHLGFDEARAHRMIAGADMFLMPSLYEPCGLTQMYSLAYGTAPIVRKTGGLNDTVSDFDGENGTGVGFKFNEYSFKATFEKIREATTLYRDFPMKWNRMMENAMSEDNSWARSAREYQLLYRMAMDRKQNV
jgi:starch synthase